MREVGRMINADYPLLLQLSTFFLLFGMLGTFIGSKIRTFTGESAISQIIANVSLSASNSNLSASFAIREFTILKDFNVTIHPPRMLLEKEVIWCPQIACWIKGNCDGAFASGKAACGEIFRNKFGQFMGAFAEVLNFGNSLFAKLNGAMRSIEFAKSKNWSSFWL